MRIMETKVYQFDELSDEAKKKARDWYRDGDDFNPEMEGYKDAGKILGIDNMDISYSGFWSQGDGASFTGDYSNAGGASKTIRDEWPMETELHAIADELTALQSATRLLHGVFVECSIVRGSYARSVHSGVMDIQTPDGEGDAPFDEEREKTLLKIFRRFADWIYEQLEEENEYQSKDETVDENITANEYEFDEDGGIA